ncbi:MAG: hypothetical protein ABWX83_03440 [Luteibacter sp.]
MNTLHRLAPRLLVSALSLSMVAVAAASPQEQAGAHSTSYELHRDEQSMTASITGIDKQNHLVTLRGPKGKSATVEAGPEVRNFDQLKVGDQVTVSFQSALAFELLPADSAEAGVEATQQVDTAARGDKPGASDQRSVTVTAKLTAVDLKKHTVTLTGADGNSRTIEVKDPSRQARMKALKVGQMVRITYAEALAVSVTPKPAATP